MPRKSECLLQPGQTILFDGDSLTSRRSPKSPGTWPYLRLMNWDSTYADEIEHFLFCVRPDLGLQFRNVGVGGSCCRDVLDRLETHVVPARPDWVIMTLGGNDCRREIPLKEFRAAMTHYARRVAETSGGRLVFVAGFRPGPHYPQAKQARRTRLPRYYRVLREVAQREDGVYLDVGKGLLARARLLYKQWPGHTVYSDGGHFNAVGNRIIAAEILNGLRVAWSDR